MAKLKESKMNNSKIKQLKENGLRIDDICAITPYQGRKRQFILNRAKFELNLGPYHNIEKDGFKICLPALQEESALFSLSLVSLSLGHTHELSHRFLLESRDSNIFKVNGNYVFKCFLQRGDIVDLGYNRFIFGIANDKNEDEHDCVADQFLKNKLTKYNINLLIEGETGTGKTRLAKKIHESSGRAGNFIHLNLTAFSASLIESELFGHVKGAFTGADKDKKGAILEANFGTLFLDEIDSISIEMQTKLLLFLDSKTVRAVGGHENCKIDVRLIFASGQKLKYLVKDGKMRRDFYFRLISGGQVFLPSLKDRPSMVEFLCNDFCSKNGIYISKKLLEFYKNISWPGNIRQLLGHLEKKSILVTSRRLEYDEYDKELLGDDSYLENRSIQDNFKPFSEVKKDYFTKVFMYYEENYLLASKVLQISPQTLKTTINYPANKE